MKGLRQFETADGVFTITEHPRSSPFKIPLSFLCITWCRKDDPFNVQELTIEQSNPNEFSITHSTYDMGYVLNENKTKTCNKDKDMEFYAIIAGFLDGLELPTDVVDLIEQRMKNVNA